MERGGARRRVVVGLAGLVSVRESVCVSACVGSIDDQRSIDPRRPLPTSSLTAERQL